jgi:hypothetical protein
MYDVPRRVEGTTGLESSWVFMAFKMGAKSVIYLWGWGCEGLFFGYIIGDSMKAWEVRLDFAWLTCRPRFNS